MESGSRETIDDRRWPLAYYGLSVLVLAVGVAAALTWSGSALGVFVELPQALGNVQSPPISFDGLGGILLGVIQIPLIGIAFWRLFFPREKAGFEGTILAVGLGLGWTALLATILSLLLVFNLVTLEVGLLGSLAVLAGLSVRHHKRALPTPTKSSASHDHSDRPVLSAAEVLAIGVLAFIVTLMVYQALFYPIVETDSIIYHSSLAAIVYYNGGLPWIVGGGVGLTSSSNYPQAFSVLGSAFYFWAGGVHDVYFRLLAVTTASLSFVACFLLGRALGGRRVGFLAALLAAAVPSYISYATLTTYNSTFVLFVTLGFYGFVKASQQSSARWSIIGGFYFGFACLTSYQGLYAAAPLAAIAGYHLIRSRSFRDPRTFRALLAVVSAICIGAAPYIRNAILLHDPVYPFLESVFPSPYTSPVLLNLNYLEWRGVSRDLVFISPYDASWFTFVVHLGSHPAFLPLNLMMAIPAFLSLPATRLLFKKELTLFFVIPTVFILAGPIAFVRYLWLLIPFVSVALAAMVVAAADAARNLPVRSPRLEAPKRLAAALPASLVGVLIILPIAVGFAGNAYSYTTGSPGTPLLRYFVHPGMGNWDYLQATYGADVLGWRWLSENVQPGERVASLEIRVYYIPQVLKDPHTMLYLDSQEAEPLLGITDPSEIVGFLGSHGVKYVFVRGMDWGGVYRGIMPLFRWLSSPYFPEVLNIGGAVIYRVGIQPSPIVVPGIPVGIWGLDGPISIDGRPAMLVRSDSVQPRISVVAGNRPELMMLRYRDDGLGSFEVNVFNPLDGSWFTMGVVAKHGSGQWRNASFVVPSTGAPFVLLGLHARAGDVPLDRIEVQVVDLPQIQMYGVGGGLLTHATHPPAIFVYLPLLRAGGRVSASATAMGWNLSLELFAGQILPSWTTEWWTHYRTVVRSPQLPTYGVESPAIDWTAGQAGLYTLVIVLWSAPPSMPPVDYQIQIQK